MYRLYKGSLYDDIKEKAEELRAETANDGWGGLSLKDCVNKSIDYYWEDLLNEEEYLDWDEDDLADALEKTICQDIRGVSYVGYNSSYWGLSNRERNY